MAIVRREANKGDLLKMNAEKASETRSFALLGNQSSTPKLNHRRNRNFLEDVESSPYRGDKHGKYESPYKLTGYHNMMGILFRYDHEIKIRNSKLLAEILVNYKFRDIPEIDKSKDLKDEAYEKGKLKAMRVRDYWKNRVKASISPPPPRES